MEGGEMVIEIGADSPGLPLRFFEQARSRLQSADAILGPCEDGGFYLLGLRRCPPGLLEGIAWSRQDTLFRVRARLRKFGLRSALLERWFDVDLPQDLDQLRSLIASGEIIAPRTAAVLQHPFVPKTVTAHEERVR